MLEIFQQEKKEKQIAALDKYYADTKTLFNTDSSNYYFKKISSLLSNNGIIRSDDKNAVKGKFNGGIKMESKNIIGLLKADKNGVEMKTGEIVEVKNAYFKNDNGIYFIDNAPGDASWCGSDYSLKKMCKNGKLSTATHNVAFWPLCAFTNNRQKNAECREWNEKNATIEIIYNIDNAQVIKHFKQQAETLEKQITRQVWDFGEESEIVIKSTEIKNHYLSVVERLGKTEAPDQVQEPEKSEPIQEVKSGIERKYFPINESLAKTSQSLWSFNDYKTGSATESYKKEVEKAYTLAEKVAAAKPDRLGDVLSLAERFSKYYAAWINKGYSIEMMCPSVMICGAGNFPVRKKEKQNSARDKHMSNYEYITGYLKKIESILYSSEVIRSDDKNAVQKIKDKITKLEAMPDPYGNKKAEIRRLKQRLLQLAPEEVKQGKVITVNGREATFENIVAIFNDFEPKKSRFSDNDEEKYYLNILLVFSDGKRKYSGFVSNEVNKDATQLSTYGNRENNYQTIWKPLTDKLKFMLIISKISGSGNKAVIYSILKDLLPKEESSETEENTAQENEVFKVVQNKEIMRLQLFFDNIPNAEIRTLLKSNGFKWAPSQKAWQRLLNENALYSLKRVQEAIKKIA